MFRLPDRGRRWIFASGVLLGLIAGGTFYSSLRPAHAAPTAALEPLETRGVTSTEGASSGPATNEELVSGLSDALASLADRITPAVVQIEVRKPLGQAAEPELQIPDPFRRFFQLPEVPPGEQAPRFGSGSGFLVSADGYIVTNNHVVAGADEITVRLNDRTEHAGTVVGRDPTTDIAVVKIDGRGLPYLRWGSSEALRVGQMVMAIGNPGVGGGPLDYTVTTGIVSAKGRPLSIIQRSLQNDPNFGGSRAGYAIENFIQTDAVINPGNSGGPMVNVQGEVVGVNSAIASTDGYYQGYGFAIPSDLAGKVARNLMEFGRIRRPWLGVAVTPVTSEDAEVYKLPAVQGVLVQSVAEDGPARRAGIEQEDVILAVEGEAVERPGDLQQLIAENEPGATVHLTVYRDGRQRHIAVHLAESPVESAAQTAVARGSAPEAAATRFGIQVADLTPALAGRYGLAQQSGVVIVGVTPWMAAGRKGLREGLVILQLDHEPVRDAAGFQRRLKALPQDAVASLKVVDADGVERVFSLRSER